MTAGFSIAHVTPYPWEAQKNGVNAHVARVTGELSARGHRVLVLAPSRSQERVRSTLVARRFVETFFGRLDARTASTGAAAELMGRHFPGEYQLVPDDALASEALEEIYRAVAARRHDSGGDAALRRRLARRP